MKIAILDYGVGNIFSIKRAIERAGESVILSKDLSEEFDGIVLPGVGNFNAVMSTVSMLRHRIIEIISSGIPILGICLGMHVLLDGSDEGGEGLSVFRGRAVRFPRGLKVPHIGWNTIHIVSDHEILNGVRDGSWVYFVHSYYPSIIEGNVVLTETEYGLKFPSMIAKNNIIGTQFHPEKSATVGSIIVRNFLRMCKR